MGSVFASTEYMYARIKICVGATFRLMELIGTQLLGLETRVVFATVDAQW